MTKKSNLSIKIENWNDKRFIVVREKGKIKARREWSRSFTLEKAKNKYKSDKTLKEGVSVYPLQNVKEVFDYSQKPSIKASYVKVLYQYEGFVIKNNKRIIIYGRSKYVNVSEIKAGYIKVSEMQEYARASFFERVSEAFGRGYDEDSGMKYIETGRAGIIKHGLVRYEEI